MNKKILSILGLSLIITACSIEQTQQPITENVVDDPLLKIIQNHDFDIEDTQNTEIIIKREVYGDLTVKIKEKGQKNDLEKNAEYEMSLKKENGTWHIYRNVLMEDDCNLNGTGCN